MPFSSASVVSIKNGRSSYFPFIHIAVKILHFRFDLHSVLGHLVTVRPMTPSWVVQTMFDPLSLLDVRFLEHEIHCITLSIITLKQDYNLEFSCRYRSCDSDYVLQHLYARALVLIGRSSKSENDVTQERSIPVIHTTGLVFRFAGEVHTEPSVCGLIDAVRYYG